MALQRKYWHGGIELLLGSPERAMNSGLAHLVRQRKRGPNIAAFCTTYGLVIRLGLATESRLVHIREVEKDKGGFRNLRMSRSRSALEIQVSWPFSENINFGGA